MTNAELITIAKKETETMFARRTARTGENFLVEVEKRSHNGAYVSVKVIVPYIRRHNVSVGKDGNYVNAVKTFSGNEYWTVGAGGFTVYAISGEKSVIDRIHNAYDSFC